MPDIIQLDADDRVYRKYHDNGDGSHSEEVRNVASTTDSTTLQNAATTAVNGTTLTVDAYPTVITQVTGTFVGTVAFEVQAPDGTWVATYARPAVGLGVFTTVNAPGLYVVDVAGFTSFRTRVSAISSGSVTVRATASSVVAHTDVQNVNLASGLHRDTDSTSTYEKPWSYFKVTANTVVSSTPIIIGGYTCSASTSGTLSLYDNASAASGDSPTGDLSRALTAGDQRILSKPILFNNGAYAAIGGTSATVFILTRTPQVA